jgi:hypothetical protein
MSVSATYKKMEAQRQQYLNRARECALLTIPSLMPPEGHNGTQPLKVPYQGMGERGVRNLASKLVLIMLPPNTPFQKLSLSKADQAALEAEVGEVTTGEITKAFGNIEREIVDNVEASNTRTALFEAAKQLIVSGNILIRMKKDWSMRAYKLNQYVVRRDGTGKPTIIILKQEAHRDDLGPEILDACGCTNEDKQDANKDNTLSLYTQIVRTDKRWEYATYLNDIMIPGSNGHDPLDNPSWLCVRMTSIDGEDYGRSYCEELLGDLTTFDGLSRHLMEGAAAMAKMILVLRPGSVLKPEDLKRENLAIVRGNADEVQVVQMEKSNDFTVAFQHTQTIGQRLEHSFLLASGVQRQAERVTAEEIRLMAQELNDALGGVYSTLSQELQAPMATYYIGILKSTGRLKQLPKSVKVTITTGIQALGRGHDLEKMRAFITDLVAVYGPEAAANVMKQEEFVNRLAGSHGVDVRDLVKTAEEVQAEQAAAQEQAQQAQMMEAAMKSPAAGEVVKAATNQGTQ